MDHTIIIALDKHQKTRETLNAMHDAHKKLCFKAGTRIFSIGDTGADAYIIEDGKIEISVEKDGETIPVDTIGKGAIFGEMALLAGDTRLVNATAIDHCEVYPVTPERIDKLIKESSPFIQALLRVMALTVQKLTVGK